MSILPLMILVITAVAGIFTITASIRCYGPAFRLARQELENGRAQIRYRYSVISQDMRRPSFPCTIRQATVRTVRSAPNRHQRKHAAKLAKAA